MTVRIRKTSDPLIPWQVEDGKTGIYLAGFGSERGAREYCSRNKFKIATTDL